LKLILNYKNKKLFSQNSILYNYQKMLKIYRILVSLFAIFARLQGDNGYVLFVDSHYVEIAVIHHNIEDSMNKKP
jgi:hypothetical protein